MKKLSVEEWALIEKLVRATPLQGNMDQLIPLMERMSALLKHLYEFVEEVNEPESPPSDIEPKPVEPKPKPPKEPKPK